MKVLAKVLARLLAIFLATAVIGAGQESGSGPRIAEEVRNSERSKFDALQRRDNTTLDTLLDDGLRWVDPNGSLWTKADYLLHLHNPQWQLLEISPESMSLHVSGDIAIVAGIYHERGLRAGHPYLLRGRFIDTWVFKKGKWVCIGATATAAIS